MCHVLPPLHFESSLGSSCPFKSSDSANRCYQAVKMFCLLSIIKANAAFKTLHVYRQGDMTRPDGDKRAEVYIQAFLVTTVKWAQAIDMLRYTYEVFLSISARHGVTECICICVGLVLQIAISRIQIWTRHGRLQNRNFTELLYLYRSWTSAASLEFINGIFWNVFCLMCWLS